MGRVAVVWVDDDGITVFAEPSDPLDRFAAERGGRRDRSGDGWVLAGVHEEDVCTALDRLGYRWAAQRRVVARTWAERLFAELPPRLWDEVHDALRDVLAGPGGDADHAAVFEWAWRNRHDWLDGGSAGG